ncbi:hypothetical protein ACE6ED_00685 [Paenibacillus sp. CN-4]|uniref:hypothetical protein n=1 Tax=Paenibacillus nanchangensis TaxID=3348343 RepID=UPI0039782113
MMIGNLFFNIVFGLIGFVLTFLVTMGNNLLMTSLIRGIFGFILWFLLAFILRWVLGFIVKQSAPPEPDFTLQEESEAGLGEQLDLTTPDEDEELNNLLKPKPDPASQSSDPGFTPLQPPKLVSMKDPEELAKAVRHLKEEE